MKGAKRVALGGMLTALSVALLWISGFTQIGNHSIDAIAGIILYAGIIELNKRGAILIYFVVTFLSFLIIPNKEPVIMYGTVFGLYSILKTVIEQIKNPAIVWVLKILSANFCIIIAGSLLYWLGVFPKKIIPMLIPFILLSNIAFVVYDIALSRLIRLYIERFKGKII